MDINIKELTVINEMAMTVGLVMLTIGNFLGGMWANESWGRYWGWDPKETWASDFYHALCICTAHAFNSWFKRKIGI